MDPTGADELATTGEGEPLFRWDTLKEVEPYELNYKPRIRGTMFEVELTSGEKVSVWRSDEGPHYFCHGLTFGGKDAPGGPISPFTGVPVETILRHHFELIPEAEASAGDILVWRGIAPNSTPHSAVLTAPIVTPGRGYLDEATTVQSKNGMDPEANVTLGELFGDYGESYNVYRRRQTLTARR